MAHCESCGAKYPDTEIGKRCVAHVDINVCAKCGQPNLKAAKRCWNCGNTTFKIDKGKCAGLIVADEPKKEDRDGDLQQT